jgi:malonyl-CoA O-methyltransferase
MSTDSAAYLDKRKVSEAFSRAAAHYEPLATLQNEVGDGLLERLEIVNLLAPPQQILDVGAGTGRITRLLAQRYPKAQLYAADIARGMLQQARQQIPWHNRLLRRSRQHFVQADATQLPFASHSMDIIVSNLMLQWCNDFQAVAMEFARILKPDGILLFSTLGPDTLKELRQSWATVDADSHVNQFIDMHDIGDALLHAGLHNPVMDVDWLTYHFPSVKDLMKDLKQIGAHNVTAGRAQGLTGKGKLQAVIQAYETYRDAEGLPVSYEVIYGHALGALPKRERLAPQGEVTIPISQIGRR